MKLDQVEYRICDVVFFFFQAEDGIRDLVRSRGLGDVYKRQTYHTVAEDPFKASALVFFPDIRSACEAVIRLKPQPVSAVELLDRPALRSVQDLSLIHI